MQTIETTYTVQLKVNGEWGYYSGAEYPAKAEAEALAAAIYGGQVETRIVTVTKTVDADPMTVVIETDDGPTRWAL